VPFPQSPFQQAPLQHVQPFQQAQLAPFITGGGRA